MNWKGINQIGSFLTQAGVPAGQSQDIVIRLKAAFEAVAAAANRPGGAGGDEQREITGKLPGDAEALQPFQPPEVTGRGSGGGGGIIGGIGFFPGEDGEDGAPGESGGGGGGYPIGNLPIILPVEPECNQFRRAFRNCGCDSLVTMYRACGLEKKLPGLSCPGLGMSICETLKAHARMLKKIRERLDKIEKMLKDTVDCP